MNHTGLMAKFGLKHPLIVAPMAGGPSTAELVAAASAAGALGAMGAAYMGPLVIEEFVRKVRSATDATFSINLFIPHAEPKLSAAQISQCIEATAPYRKELGLPEPQLAPPYEEDFDAQFEAVLKARPAAISFTFGLLPERYVRAAKDERIPLIGTATTVKEATALEASGVDAITLQGIEAGGHRGIFDASANDEEVKLFDLLDACAGKISIPLIAAGGIMTAEHIRTALARGAAAVQMGTAFLACSEAGTPAPYRAKLLATPERKTRTTRVFSGRLARGIENRFMDEMEANADAVLPFPAQNKFTRDLRTASAARGLPDFLSLWSGTGHGDLWQGPAGELIRQLFPG